MANKFVAFSAATAALSMLLLTTPASARQGGTVRAGVLTCEVKGGAGFVIGSSKELRCHFEASGGQSERYVGAINKYGLDVGITGNAVMTWVVLAPTTKVHRGALSGNYVGASAEVSAGIGGGANVLVGGSGKTISLQPLSVQGETGINAALAIASLELRSVRR